MPNLDLFQLKNHIWHININLIFFGVFFLSIAKVLYLNKVKVKKKKKKSIINLKNLFV